MNRLPTETSGVQMATADELEGVTGGLSSSGPGFDFVWADQPVPPNGGPGMWAERLHG
jgi:hypothetical protein